MYAEEIERSTRPVRVTGVWNSRGSANFFVPRALLFYTLYGFLSL